jgi:hypothetical protein
MSTAESRQEKIEHATIWHLVSAIATICAADPNIIIDNLTGYTWDEEEASKIKGSNV